MLKFLINNANKMTFSPKKSQIASEFMLFSGIALILAIIFVSASLSQAKTLYQTKESLSLRDVALKTQNEISIAANSEDGYLRQFELPEKIGDRPYNISIKSNTVTAWTNTTSYIISTLNASGYLKKGSNSITKTNGIENLN